MLNGWGYLVDTTIVLLLIWLMSCISLVFVMLRRKPEMGIERGYFRFSPEERRRSLVISFGIGGTTIVIVALLVARSNTVLVPFVGLIGAALAMRFLWRNPWYTNDSQEIPNEYDQ